MAEAARPAEQPASAADEFAYLVEALRVHLEWAQDLGLDGYAPEEPPPVEAAIAPVEELPPPGLDQLRQSLGECTRCRLHEGRAHLVFGTGSPTAELMFVGEGPGREEDLQGEPFVGEAGRLLDRIIKAMGFTREEVYIANVVKCRPPRNRDPWPDEIAACEPVLRRQVAAIRPRVIVTLGKFASQTLIGSDLPISRLRGRWHAYQEIALMPTFHPAYLLRNPEGKREVWEDMQQVMKVFGKEPPSRRGR